MDFGISVFKIQILLVFMICRVESIHIRKSRGANDPPEQCGRVGQPPCTVNIKIPLSYLNNTSPNDTMINYQIYQAPVTFNVNIDRRKNRTLQNSESAPPPPAESKIQRRLKPVPSKPAPKPQIIHAMDMDEMNVDTWGGNLQEKDDFSDSHSADVQIAGILVRIKGLEDENTRLHAEMDRLRKIVAGKRKQMDDSNVLKRFIDSSTGDHKTQGKALEVHQNRGDFPWLVSVMLKNKDGSLQHLCGGTLVDLSFIITGAHCVMQHYSSDLMILAGALRLNEFEANQQLRQVDEVKVHPLFNYTSLENDIARLRLSIPFMENVPFVRKVAFPPTNHVATGSCTIAGWGSATDESTASIPSVLKKASLTVVPRKECSSVYPKAFDSQTQICAGFDRRGAGACVDDTGGALICKDLGQVYFAGISSRKYVCGRQRYPGVFTEISKYIKWILD